MRAGMVEHVSFHILPATKHFPWCLNILPLGHPFARYQRMQGNYYASQITTSRLHAHISQLAASCAGGWQDEEGTI